MLPERAPGIADAVVVGVRCAPVFDSAVGKSNYCQIDFFPFAFELLRLRMCLVLRICFSFLQENLKNIFVVQSYENSKCVNYSVIAATGEPQESTHNAPVFVPMTSHSQTRQLTMRNTMYRCG